MRQSAVVDPDVSGPEYGNGVAVGLASVPDVGRAGAYVRVAGGDTVVNVHVVDDDVADVLERNAAAAGDVDVGAAPVHGLVAVEDELVLQLDGHVGGEDDPQRLRLDHGVPERPRLRLHRVRVGGVGDDVDLAAFPAHCRFFRVGVLMGESEVEGGGTEKRRRQ
nr:hypothetical protein Pyn_29454 [Ipomoea batatas]